MTWAAPCDQGAARLSRDAMLSRRRHTRQRPSLSSHDDRLHEPAARRWRSANPPRGRCDQPPGEPEMPSKSQTSARRQNLEATLRLSLRSARTPRPPPPALHCSVVMPRPLTLFAPPLANSRCASAPRRLLCNPAFPPIVTRPCACPPTPARASASMADSGGGAKASPAVVQIGTGTDLHGQDPTVAAVRACRSTLAPLEQLRKEQLRTLSIPSSSRFMLSYPRTQPRC